MKMSMPANMENVPAASRWMGTSEVCERLGVTLRTLYRFIDEGDLPAYKLGRVIRLQSSDVEDFLERIRIKPGTLEHLYPEPRRRAEEAQGSQAAEDKAKQSPFAVGKGALGPEAEPPARLAARRRSTRG